MFDSKLRTRSLNKEYRLVNALRRAKLVVCDRKKTVLKLRVQRVKELSGSKVRN